MDNLPKSPDGDVDKSVVKAVQGFLEPMAPLIEDFGRAMSTAYEEAEAKVKAEHPHWFITYPDNKKIDGNRRAKINSRAKKRHHAIQKAMREHLGATPGELMVRMLDEFNVIQGVADEDTEVRYLEDALERPPNPVIHLSEETDGIV